MTWEELKEKAKELGCETNRPSIKLNVDRPYVYYIFTKEGMVFFYYTYQGRKVLAKHRTPDQMYQIISALR
jgi:hypothetical protein